MATKQATTIGVGRALAEANICKSVYRGSRMVYGYGKTSNGYELRKNVQEKRIMISYFMNPFATIGLSEEQIAEKQQQQNNWLRGNLEKIETVLRAKGFDAVAIFTMNNEQLDGKVIVHNAKV